jgi:hypothetical protein
MPRDDPPHFPIRTTRLLFANSPNHQHLLLALAEHQKVDVRESHLAFHVKSLIYKDNGQGRVPLVAKDENGESAMPLFDVYTSHPELAEYHYSKFSRQLSCMRKTIAELMDLEKEDQQDFAAYISNHPASSFLHHGYIQYQGSEAQELLKQDIEEQLH